MDKHEKLIDKLTDPSLTQLYESYPMAFLGDPVAEDFDSALAVLSNIVRGFHMITLEDDSKFWDTIDKDEFSKLSMWITNKYYNMSRVDGVEELVKNIKKIDRWKMKIGYFGL